MSTPRIFTCDDCKYVFKKRSHLLRHILIHSDERPYSCNQCGKAFRSTSHLQRHSATHSGEKNFRCEYEGCEVACITEWNLKRHVKRTHMGKFKCKKCGKEFKKNKQLHEHTLIEHKNSTICCEFPGCGRMFTMATKMRHHLKMHTGRGYICPVKDCSMKFALWSECRLHAARCKEKKVSCDVCQQTFMERSNLKAHKKIHLENREVFQCTYEGCGRFYTKQYNLKVHVQSFHLNIRPYVCTKEGCNKRFHFQHLLRKHLDFHNANVHQAKDEKKKKRSRRVKASLASEISGYIPELWKHMSIDEMKQYAPEDNDGYSTVADRSTSSSVSPNLIPDIRDSNDSLPSVIKVPAEKQESDTEPTDGSVVEMVEIRPFLYKAVRTSRKTDKFFLQRSLFQSREGYYADTLSDTDACGNLKKSRTATECRVELHNLFDERRKTSPTPCSSFMQDCRIQSKNESDSSDSEIQMNHIHCVV